MTHLESHTLTGLGHLLDRHELEALLLEASLGITLWLAEEVLNDFNFLDWERVQVDDFEGLDLAAFHETSELGAWHPLFFVALAASAASAATATSTATATSVTSVTTASSL